MRLGGALPAADPPGERIEYAIGWESEKREISGSIYSENWPLVVLGFLSRFKLTNFSLSANLFTLIKGFCGPKPVGRL